MMNFLLSLLFPQRCLFCNKIISEGTWLCEQHKGSIPFVKEPLCHRCGKKILKEEDEFCYDCHQREHYFEQGFACFEYKEEIAASIFRFKYKQARYLGKGYTQLMASHLGAKLRKLNCDYIIGVPIAKAKMRERGYNQADILAQYLGEKLQIKWIKDGMRRKKHTKPLKSLNAHQRKKVLEDVFVIDRDWCVCGKKILIVDDIYTTGSTIDEMSKVLKKYGAKSVYFVCLSIGQGI